MTPPGRALVDGYTLPASWYSDPDVLRREQERIFRRSWQYAGRAEELADPGDYVTCRAGDVPVVVVRDEGGELRAYVNVCRHRGHEVASGAGNRRTLQCPYHAWTYGLDGALLAAPRTAREPGLEKSELSLLPTSVETWGPFLFVHPDPAAS
ncbi:MAG: Rieske (2Fe-2S) protein, partial [Actinobacteria bacterium]|nr:Rieske (2Fe-2S) protein [Actinomycetota bacterium]